jgi:hypothetical protein
MRVGRGGRKGNGWQGNPGEETGAVPDDKEAVGLVDAVPLVSGFRVVWRRRGGMVFPATDPSVCGAWHRPCEGCPWNH